MREDLDRELCKLAPMLFANRNGSMRETCMCWGFECGDGWFPILERAAKKLEAIIVQMKQDRPEATDLPRCSQIKEKLGTLCFYMSSSTAEMDAITDEAEALSAVTCELCGSPGLLTTSGYWLSTRCPDCKKDDQRWYYEIKKESAD